MLTKSQTVAASLSGAALMIALSGCAPQTAVESPVPQPSTTASSAPAPEFAQLADGDCDTLLQSTQIAAALGASTVVDEYFTGGGIPSLSVVGGLRCHWAYGEQGSSGFAQAFLDVVPASIADPGEIESAAARSCGDGCKVDALANDWWYELYVATNGASVPVSAATDAVVELVETALAAETAPGKISAMPAIDCASADTGGLPVTTSHDSLPAGSGFSPMVFAADRLARPTTCAFTLDSAVWYASVFPGTAAGYDVCRAGAEGQTVTVAGVAEAFAPRFDGGLSVCTTDGTSSVVVGYPDDGYVTSEWTEASLATAATMAAPLLMVASA